jgi:hypothetical protein
MLANISNPVYESLVALWNDTPTHTSFQVDTSISGVISFLYRVEPPNSPMLEFLIPTILTGNA